MPEHAIDPGMEPHAVIAWFGERAPVSDIGKVRLGEALIATGPSAPRPRSHPEGLDRRQFEPQQEFAIIQRDGAYLTPDIDRERMERLIARNDLSGARREMSRVTSSDQRIADARLAPDPSGERRTACRRPPRYGARRSRSHLRSHAACPPEARNRGGTEADPARTDARNGENQSARWWEELDLDTREAIKATDYASAYAIASHSGLTAGDGLDYSEAQFLAGWIALRFLKDPATALTHFRNIAQSVTRPISRAKAHYWEGRAYEAAGDLAQAWQQYKLASEVTEASTDRSRSPASHPIPNCMSATRRSKHPRCGRISNMRT